MAVSLHRLDTQSVRTCHNPLWEGRHLSTLKSTLVDRIVTKISQGTIIPPNKQTFSNPLLEQVNLLSVAAVTMIMIRDFRILIMLWFAGPSIITLIVASPRASPFRGRPLKPWLKWIQSSLLLVPMKLEAFITQVAQQPKVWMKIEQQPQQISLT